MKKIYDNMVTSLGYEVTRLGLSKIRPYKFRDKGAWNEAIIDDLVKKIKKNGILFPILVKESKGLYEIVDGRLRCEAASIVGLKTIPAIITKINDTNPVLVGTYFFDKKDCRKCRYKGYDEIDDMVLCLCSMCARMKNIDYIVERCLLIREDQPEMIFANRGVSSNLAAIQMLRSIDFEVVDIHELELRVYPTRPINPCEVDFDDILEYHNAQVDYNVNMEMYHNAMMDIGWHVRNGGVKIYVCIEEKTTQLYYCLCKKKRE